MSEDDFIVNAARLKLSEENIFILRKISNDGIDWASFEKKACMHGVSNFIYYSLKSHNLSHLIPSYIFKKFQEDYYRVAFENSIFIEAFGKVSGVINEKIVLLKGMGLIQSLYPNIGVRSMCDIDILVEKEKVMDIWNNLQSNGFTQCLKYVQPDKSRVHNEAKIKVGKHLVPLYDERCTIEVHWNLFNSPDFYNITETALKKTVSISSNNKIYLLSNEYLIIHLCSHFYWHLRTKVILRMLCDINEFVLKNIGGDDWDKINEICINPELKNEVITALTYAHVLLKTPVPANLLNANLIEDNSTRLDCLFNLVKQKGVFSKFFSNLKTCDREVDKLVFIFRTIAPEKKWINTTYRVKTNLGLPYAYCKYWSYLVRRHILKRTIRYAN